MSQATCPKSFIKGESANKAFLRNPSSPRAQNHMLSKVNIVNAFQWRDPLTNHGNEFLVRTSMRW